jgi:hypothetical protein
MILAIIDIYYLKGSSQILVILSPHKPVDGDIMTVPGAQALVLRSVARRLVF